MYYPCSEIALRKHTHVIYRDILSCKTMKETFFYVFLIFAQNIDGGYTLEPPQRGGSNEYPQSMFCSKNNKNRYTPANPSFFYIKGGFKGVSLHGHVFLIEGADQLRNYCEADLHLYFRLGKNPVFSRCDSIINKPRRGKTNNVVSEQARTGPTQTGLCSYRRWLETGNFVFRK